MSGKVAEFKIERQICCVFLCAFIDFWFYSHRENVLVPSPEQWRGPQQCTFAQKRSWPK